MTLYNEQGQPLSAQDLRTILQGISAGDENVPRVFTSPGDPDSMVSGRGGGAVTDAIQQALTDAGFDEGGQSARGSDGQYYIPLDDPNKLAQAQQAGVATNVSGVPVANYNDPNLRGGIGSGALFADMPQENTLSTIAPALLGAAGGIAGGLAGLGGAAEGVGAGSGIGGGAGGAIASPGLWGGAIDTANGLGLGLETAGVGGLGAATTEAAPAAATGAANAAPALDYSMTGTLGGGTGTAAAGSAADAAALGGGAVLGSEVAPYSLASGVGGGLGGAETLGAAGVGLGGGVANGIGNAAGNAAATAGTGAMTGDSGAANTTFGIPNNVLQGLLTGAGGLLAANQSADAYKDVANQYMNIGAPYRNTLSQSYQPGFDLSSQPGYGDAFGRIADISSRAYSAKAGNPAGNPTAQAGILSDVWNQGYLPALSNYRGQLGQFGGLGLNTSGTGALAGASQTGSGFEALGAGLGQAINPQPSLSDLLKQFGTGNQNLGLSVGGLSLK